MGIKPIDLQTWKRFLIAQGLIHVRTKGGHEHWNTPDSEDDLWRPITFSNHMRQLPRRILGTCLKTLEISNVDFEKELKNKVFKNLRLKVEAVEDNEYEVSFIVDGPEKSTIVYAIDKKTAVAVVKEENGDCTITKIRATQSK